MPPSPLQGLLERCLTLNPAQRPRSAAEVLTELDRIQRWAALTPGPCDLQAAKRRLWGADREPRHDVQHAYRRLLGADWKPRYSQQAEQSLRDANQAASASRSLSRTQALAPWAALVVLTVAVLIAGIALLGVGNGLARAGVGLAIVGVALAVAQQIRHRWTSRAPEAERQAATILFGAGQRDELTRSLMIEVDQVVRNLKSFDTKFPGMTPGSDDPRIRGSKRVVGTSSGTA